MSLSLLNDFKLIKGRVFRDFEIKNLTTFKVGGKVDYLVIPKDVEDIKTTLKIGKDKNLPVYIMGNGSNLLVSDKGIRGIVLRISKENFNRVELKGNLITSESGVPLSELISLSIKNGLSGLENLYGIPGVLGGVIAMNAGTDGCSIGDFIKEIKAIDASLNQNVLSKEEIIFSYRKSSILEKKLIVIEAKLELKKDDKERIFKTLREKIRKRKKTQPINFPTAGCVFKNEGENKAGYLIEKAGCKGLKIGDAEVSTLHANFILNRGNATFKEIISLMKLVREMVYEKFKITLNPEVVILGEVEEALPFNVLEPW
ncbi:MAG: UDP-N-acetylmuramate dehydrogenase [Caldisericia bacterium]|nr:UDP-N-acetylmuramate dehydrogenase [Caldisericia bacterium]